MQKHHITYVFGIIAFIITLTCGWLVLYGGIHYLTNDPAMQGTYLSIFTLLGQISLLGVIIQLNKLIRYYRQRHQVQKELSQLESTVKEKPTAADNWPQWAREEVADLLITYTRLRGEFAEKYNAISHTTPRDPAQALEQLAELKRTTVAQIIAIQTEKLEAIANRIETYQQTAGKTLINAFSKVVQYDKELNWHIQQGFRKFYLLQRKLQRIKPVIIDTLYALMRDKISYKEGAYQGKQLMDKIDTIWNQVETVLDYHTRIKLETADYLETVKQLENEQKEHEQRIHVLESMYSASVSQGLREKIRQNKRKLTDVRLKLGLAKGHNEIKTMGLAQSYFEEAIQLIESVKATSPQLQVIFQQQQRAEETVRELLEKIPAKVKEIETNLLPRLHDAEGHEKVISLKKLVRGSERTFLEIQSEIRHRDRHNWVDLQERLEAIYADLQEGENELKQSMKVGELSYLFQHLPVMAASEMHSDMGAEPTNGGVELGGGEFGGGGAGSDW